MLSEVNGMKDAALKEMFRLDIVIEQLNLDLAAQKQKLQELGVEDTKFDSETAFLIGVQ